MVLHPGDLINTGTPAGRGPRHPGQSVSARGRRGRTRDRRPRPRASDAGAGMSAGEFDGLVAVVTGGASGIGLATASAFAARGARVAVLDLNPADLPEALTGFRADVTRPLIGGCGDRGRGRCARRDRHRGQQRGHQLGRNRRRGDGCRLGEGARHQRHRHGAGERVRPAVAATFGARRDRQPLLGRRAQRPAAASGVLGVERRDPEPDARDGDRPCARGRAGQLREPRERSRPRSSIGCCRDSTTP